MIPITPEHEREQRRGARRAGEPAQRRADTTPSTSRIGITQQRPVAQRVQRSSRVVRQQRPDDRVLPPPVQPDRPALASLALEAAPLGEPLRRLVVGMRAQLEPADSLRRTASRRAAAPRASSGLALVPRRRRDRRPRSCHGARREAITAPSATSTPRLGDGVVDTGRPSRGPSRATRRSASKSRVARLGAACSATCCTSGSLIVASTTARSSSRSFAEDDHAVGECVGRRRLSRRPRPYPLYSRARPFALAARAAAAAAAARRRGAGRVLAGLARRGVLRPLDELLGRDHRRRSRASGRA